VTSAAASQLNVASNVSLRRKVKDFLASEKDVCLVASAAALRLNLLRKLAFAARSRTFSAGEKVLDLVHKTLGAGIVLVAIFDIDFF
jgi:hypothetical protein